MINEQLASPCPAPRTPPCCPGSQAGTWCFLQVDKLGFPLSCEHTEARRTHSTPTMDKWGEQHSDPGTRARLRPSLNSSLVSH